MYGQPSRSGPLGRFLLPIIAFLGVPSLLVAIFRNSAAAHPTRVILVGVVYEMVAFSIVIFTQVAEKLRARLVDRIVNRLDAALTRRFSSYRRSYLQHLVYAHRFFDVQGLTTHSSFTLELEQVFVDLSIVPQNLHQISPDLLRNPTVPSSRRWTELSSGRHPIWAYLQEATESDAHFAIVGPPGSGKTTLLRHVVLALAANNHKRRELRIRTPLPVLLFLREHADVINRNPNIPLADVIRSSLPPLNVTEPPAWFETQLSEGRCLVMLDGLDEVADAEKRRRVAAWVDKQITNHARNAFLATSRPFGYRSNALSSATVMEVMPFTVAQIKTFLHNWYLATEIRTTGKRDVGVARKAEKEATDLIHRIRHSRQLLDLAVNPLLLTMIAHVHRFRSVLPGRRVDLYDEITDVCLGKRHEARGISSDLTPSQKRLVLEHLAYSMMMGKQRVLKTQDAAARIVQPLARVTASTRPEQFLKSVEELSGLLLEREANTYTFAHQSFQEYLAAVYIRENSLVDELVAMVDDEWWHETIRLYCAQADATPIIDACMASSSVSTLTLAVECLNEARDVHPQTRVRLERNLAREGERSDHGERGLAITEVQLSLRLKAMTPVDELTFLSPEPVTNAEYELFLEDVQAREEYRQPDHWLDWHHRVEDGTKPVVGLRPSDAHAFCEWLSLREHGDALYRLPSAREVGDETFADLFNRASLRCGFWLNEGGFLPQKGRETMDAGTLLDQVKLDLFQAAGEAQEQLSPHSIFAYINEKKMGPRDLGLLIQRAEPWMGEKQDGSQRHTGVRPLGTTQIGNEAALNSALGLSTVLCDVGIQKRSKTFRVVLYQGQSATVSLEAIQYELRMLAREVDIAEHLNLDNLNAAPQFLAARLEDYTKIVRDLDATTTQETRDAESDVEYLALRYNASAQGAELARAQERLAKKERILYGLKEGTAQLIRARELQEELADYIFLALNRQERIDLSVDALKLFRDVRLRALLLAYFLEASWQVFYKEALRKVTNANRIKDEILREAARIYVIFTELEGRARGTISACEGLLIMKRRSNIVEMEV